MDDKTRIAELEKQVAHLKQLLDVSSVMNSVLIRQDVGIDSVLSYLMDAAAKITESESASVLLWDEKQQLLRFAATTSGDNTAQALLGQPVPLESIAGTIVKDKTTVRVEDAINDPRHYSKTDEKTEFVTRSLLGVPMISKKRVIGVLEVVNKKQLPWTDADESNLVVLASDAAIAIEVARLVVALQRANRELNELDDLKNNFIALVSHELRTPLGLILGYASFLQEVEDADVRDQADQVMSGALRLRRIIESMVNLHYIQQKESGLQREYMSLSVITNDLKQDITSMPNSSKRHIQITCENEDIQVFIDRTRFGMALTNVITNAIDFTKEGGHIVITAKSPDHHHVEIAITDDGIGLEPDQCRRVFDQFYQVEDHMTRSHEGLGIGLSISQALIHAHGGDIKASSPGLGKGSTFTVTLPLDS